LLFEGQNFIKDKVPDVRGLSASDAIYLLESQGLSVRIIGAGQVFSQSLTPGSDFQVGQVIKIELK
jgi:cell division protein FtsI (penicillin-binding protein 3)